jgi:hypothetical protein
VLLLDLDSKSETNRANGRVGPLLLERRLLWISSLTSDTDGCMTIVQDKGD